MKYLYNEYERDGEGYEKTMDDSVVGVFGWLDGAVVSEGG